VGDEALGFGKETSKLHPETGILLTVASPFSSEVKQLRKPYGVGELWAALAR